MIRSVSAEVALIWNHCEPTAQQRSCLGHASLANRIAVEWTVQSKRLQMVERRMHPKPLEDWEMPCRLWSCRSMTKGCPATWRLVEERFRRVLFMQKVIRNILKEALCFKSYQIQWNTESVLILIGRPQCTRKQPQCRRKVTKMLYPV